jgi:predicted MFS family arabinose efflux permease
MKRTFSIDRTTSRSTGVGLVAGGTALIAVTYGLVRLAYGLYLPEMQADLGFDSGVAGTVSSGGSLAYVAGAVAGFAAAGRHSRALVVAAGATAGIGAAGMAVAPEVVPFALAAVLGSAGAGLASPALVRVLQRGLDDGRQAGAQTVVNAGTGPGLVAAGLLAFALLPDWRLAWLAAAWGAIAAAGAVLVLDRRASSSARSLVRDGAATARADAARPSGATGLGPAGPRGLLPPRSWFVAHRWVLLAALLAGAGSAGVWNYGRTLLVDAGVAAELSVGAWVCLGAGGTAVIVTARPLARLAPGAVWTLTLTVMAAGTAGVVTLPGVVPVAFVACAAFGWAYTAATGALIAWTAEIDAERAASGTALLFVLLVAGQAVGAVVLGALVGATGYGTAFLLATLAALLAALAALPGLGRLRPREVADAPAGAQGSR